MKHFSWKTIQPHAIAVAIFLIIAIIYCKPALEGKVLSQSDVTHWKGMAQDMYNYKEKHGHFPLWNNNLFGGMPGYQITLPDGGNIFSPIVLHSLLMAFPKPIGYFFLLCLGFYFLSQVIGIRYWLGILGGIAYAYATYSPVIVAVGHDTKMQAMGYMPFMIAALWLVYQKKYWWGAALTALFSALLIAMNHLQVTYYTLIVIGCMTIAFVIQWIKRKEYKHLVMALSIALVTGAIGAVTNMVSLATTNDYAKATMRGGSLSIDSSGKAVKNNGLKIDYAFFYGSYGKAETFTFLFPHIYGGSSSDLGPELGAGSHVARLAAEKGIQDDQATQFAGILGPYWGTQPGTSGPVYLGAVICFLFIFGMVYLKTWHKWWILAVSALAVLMSWGSNLAAFNSFLFHHLPLYNKFRAPDIILVVPQLLFPLLGVMALQQFLFEENDKAAALGSLKKSIYIMGGFFLVAIGLYLTFDYTGKNDEGLKNYILQMVGGKQDDGNAFYNALKQDRQSLFGGDLVRSLLFVTAAAALLWFYARNKLKAIYVLTGLLLLSSIDILSIGRNYLNGNNFQEPEALAENTFKPSPIDQEILKDTSHPRVLNLAAPGGPYNDAITSYYHRSVGGYHPAKLSIYDDLLTYQLNKSPINKHVLDMLNAKYIIVPNQQNGQQMLQVNAEALGQAWFVKHIKYVDGQAAAMKALGTFEPKDTAVVEEKFRKDITMVPVPDSTAVMQLVSNDNDEIRYRSNNRSNGFAVFSEIYYDRGWTATIDGKTAPIIQTDYVLRGLNVPAGNHEIVFEFKPASYYTSIKAAVGASALIWLLLIGAVIQTFRAPKKESA